MHTGHPLCRRSFALPLSSLLAAALLVAGVAAPASSAGVAMYVLIESFDAVTPPALPPGWGVEPVSGTSGAWSATDITAYPTGGTAHSAPYMACFNSHSAANGDSARLYQRVGLNAAIYTSIQVWFYMYHDDVSAANDRVQAQVSTDGGGSWTSVGSPVQRYSAQTGWVQHHIALGAAYDNPPDLRIALLGVSLQGNDCYIDDLQIIGLTDVKLTPPEGTIGTYLWIQGAGFGSYPGQLYFGQARAPVKLASWNNTDIVALMTKAVAPAAYDVGVRPFGTRGPPPIIYSEAFTVKPPDVVEVHPAQGSTGDTVTIGGHYFGSKKGKVYLEMSGAGGLVARSCKVMRWIMDERVGISFATVQLPKGLAAGVYDVRVINKVGEGMKAAAFEVLLPP